MDHDEVAGRTVIRHIGDLSLDRGVDRGTIMDRDEVVDHLVTLFIEVLSLDREVGR